MENGKNILDAFLTSGISELNYVETFINMLITATLSLIIRFYYVRFGQSLTNRSTFSSNFVIIAMTTMLIISIIKSSLALSLGLVGALSIVRFRTAIKDPEELGYLFLNISIGLGMGANQKVVTVFGLVIVLLCISLNYLLFKRKKNEIQENFYLTVSDSTTIDYATLTSKIIEILCQNTSQLKLKKMDYQSKTENSSTGFELSFSTQFKKIEDLMKAVAAMKNLSPTLDVSYVEMDA